MHGRWVRAAELVPGDTVATRAGTATVVRVAPHDAPEVVYNLRVERTARYLVGACGAVVHNSPCDRAAEAAREAAEEGAGRAGRQARLRSLADDPMLGSADRGWIKQEINSIERGQRSSIRNPPGKDLAHERGREAAKGYGYQHSNLQDRDLHRLQHKYDDFGRANPERPLP